MSKVDIVTYSCEYCDKSFARNFNLRRHLSVCSVKREHDIKEKIKNIKRGHKEKNQKLIEKNFKLQGKIKKMKLEMREKDEEITALKVKCEAGKIEIYDKVCDKVLDKSTVTNTTTYIHPKLVNLPITNIHPLTSDYVKDQVDNGNYTFEHYLKGENGLVDFIYSITMCENDSGDIERNYVCTDPSRDSYHRLVETKEWQKDKGGKFVDVILDTLSNRADGYHMKVFDERKKSGPSKTKIGYDPEYIYKLNTDMHSGIVQSHGKDRKILRQRIKKETSRKISV
uniref:C2H2 type zinc finger protein n=1 Tax=Marseillevirus LCMAC101 TaxID=2506602 RepID=A0A481YRL2_9VIRU|nr:MAG: C2H2 type zinc finger protein [Marseillevirus LCMAC101]